MDEEFKVGDAVMLVTGGPVMTVTNLGESDVGCTWWEPRWDKVAGTASEECGRYQVARFTPEALVLEERDDEDEEEDAKEMAS